MSLQFVGGIAGSSAFLVKSAAIHFRRNCTVELVAGQDATFVNMRVVD